MNSEAVTAYLSISGLESRLIVEVAGGIPVAGPIYDNDRLSAIGANPASQPPSKAFEDYTPRIDDRPIEADKDSVVVPKYSVERLSWDGRGGNMGLLPKLLKRGVTDAVRISDARVSGTEYGTVVLHVCPDAAIGNPPAHLDFLASCRGHGVTRESR